MIRLLTPLLLAATASAQFVYDFENLTGSDTHPYTLLDGQDNWSEQTFNANNRCGVVATLSFDGDHALRFQESGPGYGCDASRINDGTWLFAPFSGGESNAMFQCDIKVGFWGGTFGLAHDVSGDGAVRGSQPGERGVRFQIGTQANQQLRLYAADQTFVQVPLAPLGVAGGNWVRVRVIMDLQANGGAGAGSLYLQNLSTGEPGLRAVAGLQAVPLALDGTATDAKNPTLWDAMFLHFEGATYMLDNIEIGRGGFAESIGTACNGVGGPTELAANGPFSTGSSVIFESGNHAPASIGATIFGLDTGSWQGVPLPLSLDPLLGTSGCTLYTDLVVSALALTSPAGVLSTPFPIPAGWTGFVCYVQQLCLEAVPGGYSFTQALEVHFP